MTTRIAIIGLSALAIMTAANQEGVLLRRQLQPNSTEVYAVEMKSVSSTPMGDATVDGTMTITYNLGEVKDGKAELEMITSDIKMKLGGAAEMAEGMLGSLPKTVSLKAKIDDRNRISELKATGANMQMAMMMGSQSTSGSQIITFPEGPIRIGDTWQATIPANPMMGTPETKLNAKLIAERDFQGKKVYAITMNGTMPVSIDLAKMMKDVPGGTGMPIPEGMMITGKIEIKMDSLVERATGKSLQTDLVAKTASHIAGPGLPTEIDTSGTTTMKITLVK